MAVQIPFPLPSHGFALNSKMRVNLDFLVNKFNEFNTGAATWDTVAIGIANNETGTLTFYNSSNSNYLTFQPGVTSTNTTFTLPTSAPTNTRSFLRSTNTGVLSWSFFQEKASYVGNELLYVDGVGVVQEVDVGSGNRILVNSVPPSFFELLGTSNQITVTLNVGNFTLSLPQDIATSSNVQFGTVKTGAGSLSSTALKLNANNTGIYMSSATEMDFVIGGVTYAALDSSGNWFATTGETRADVIRGLSSLKVGGTVGSLITITSGASSPYSLTLPIDDGVANQYLTTNGSGVLSWTNAAGTGTVDSGTQYQLAYYATSTNAVSGLTLITASKALASDANGLPVASATTATELGYVSGVTSAIQTQLGTKAANSEAYVTIGNTSGLSAERALTGTSNQIVVTDNGANSTVVLSTPQNIHTAATPTFASLSLTATTNQLVLGTTRTATLTAPTPATSSRTYTFPDLGGDYSVITTIGSQTITGTTTTLVGDLDIQSGTVNGLIIGADNAATTRTNNTTKRARISLYNYTNASVPVTLLYGINDGTINNVNIGGGTLTNYAATIVNIYTAANATTAVGTLRFGVNSSGDIGIAATKKLFVDGADGSGDTYIVESSANVMDFYTAGAKASSISAAGEITQPLQPSFLVTDGTGAANVTGDGTEYTELWPTEVFDQGSDFSSNTFTAPVTGRYFLRVTLRMEELGTAHTLHTLRLVTSNRTYSTADTITASPFTIKAFGISVLADMDANDIATVTIQISNGTKVVDVVASAGANQFSGSLIN